MPAQEFNPDLPVVVRKEFKTADARGKMVTLAPGTEVDWRKLGWNEGRVATMVATRYLDQPAPLSRAQKKSVKRLAEARREERREERRDHSPRAAGKKAAPAKKRSARKADAEPIGDLTPDEMEVIRQMRSSKTS